MTVGDRSQGGLEVGKRFVAVDLAALDQRSDAARGNAAFIATSEEDNLSIEGDGADQVFDPVGVDLDATVVGEGLQPVPVIMDVSELFAQLGFDGDLAALCLQPVAEGCDSEAVRV